MTTPSKMKRLSEAAELYLEHCIVAHKMCMMVMNMKGTVTFPEDMPVEVQESITSVLNAQEQAFKTKLMPFIERLHELDVMIKENLPNPDRKIILPEDMS